MVDTSAAYFRGEMAKRYRVVVRFANVDFLAAEHEARRLHALQDIDVALLMSQGLRRALGG